MQSVDWIMALLVWTLAGGPAQAKVPKKKLRSLVVDDEAESVDPLTALRSRLEAAGWTVLPEISEQVDTGQLWIPSAELGRPDRRELAACIEAEPTEERAMESTSTGSGNIELEGGGGMGVRVTGRYEAKRSNEVVVTDSRTRLLDGAVQIPTEACYDHLTTQMQKKDISTWYVVTEVFRATVTNSNARGQAGSIEVKGLVASGGADGALASAQKESTSGTLAFRSVLAPMILQRADEQRRLVAGETASLEDRINEPVEGVIVGFDAAGVGEEDIAAAIAKLSEEEQVRLAEQKLAQTRDRVASTERLKQESAEQDRRDAARRASMAAREAEDSERAAAAEAELQRLIDLQVENKSEPFKEQANRDFELIRHSMQGTLNESSREVLLLFLKKYSSISVTITRSDGTQEERPVELSTVRMVRNFLNDHVPVTEPNSIGIAFAEIPPGTYEMGCTAGQGAGCEDNEPTVRVDIRNMIAVATTEVTQHQWEQVMGEVQAESVQCGPNCPMENVSWRDALEFSNRLSTLEGREACYVKDGASFQWPKGVECTGYRLLTEAEWEYAARANTDLKFAGASEPLNVAWTLDGTDGMPEPVATLEANQWHLHDMSGNVWEWVWDGYGELSQSHYIDPLGDDSAYERVCRGGSWYRPAGEARVSRRTAHRPGFRSSEVGFRVARTIP